jgi:hypothetical protein
MAAPRMATLRMAAPRMAAPRMAATRPPASHSPDPIPFSLGPNRKPKQGPYTPPTTQSLIFVLYLKAVLCLQTLNAWKH